MHTVNLDGKVKKLEVKENITTFSICEKAFTKEGEENKFTWFNCKAFGKTRKSLEGLAEGDFVSLQCEFSVSEYQDKQYPQFTVWKANFNRPQQQQNQGQGYAPQGGGYNPPGDQGKPYG